MIEQDVRIKSLWKEKNSQLWSFFCPLCRTSRRVPYRSSPGGAKHVAQIALTAAFFTLVTWNWFGWKGIISFIPLWTLFEVFYRAKVRAAVSCDSCGFDAYLYLTDVKRARTEVESHWKKKFAEKGIPYPGSEAVVVAEAAHQAADISRTPEL